MKFSLLIFSIMVSISNCKKSQKSLSEAEKIVFDSIDAHGGDLYSKAHYKFTFRDKDYIFKHNGNLFEYSVSYEKDGKAIYDFMTSEELSRSIDGVETQLSEKQKQSYGESLNSVIYFATLPYKLLDDAVNKKYQGTSKIKGKDYYVIEITFNEEGGGKDFDDTYYYWINQQTNNVDYLAYNYSVNKGGVRFRSAYNKRVVGGILFQDYVNYKAEVGTPLGDLPKMWEKGKLKELSRIETENVKKLGK